MTKSSQVVQTRTTEIPAFPFLKMLQATEYR